MRRCWIVVVVVLAAFGTSPATAEPRDRPETVAEAAQRLIARGRADQARELVARVADRYPQSELLALVRADAYLVEHNPFWALKVLTEFVERHSPACQARALAARILIDQASLDQAEELLGHPACQQPEELRARELLLRARIAELRADARMARQHVREARAIRRRYEEDERWLVSLAARHDPYHLPLVAWNFDLGAGWTRIGLAGAPLDRPAPEYQHGSAMATIDLWARLVAPVWDVLRPLVDASFEGQELLGRHSRELSTRQPALRLGVLLGPAYPRLVLAHSYDLVHLQGDDAGEPGPLVYSRAHREEYEVQVSRAMTAFGAVGYRRFHDRERSRLELEQGLSTGVELSPAVGLSGQAVVRTYHARARAHDQVGVALVGELRVALGRGFELRETLSCSADLRPGSEGAFGPMAQGERKETVVRARAGVWSPELSGLRLGLDYEQTTRNSTIQGYDFTDHRLFLHLAYQSDTDRLFTTLIPARGRVPMRHELEPEPEQGRSEPGARERMEQDQALRRSSSCPK